MYKKKESTKNDDPTIENFFLLKNKKRSLEIQEGFCEYCNEIGGINRIE